MRTMIPVLAIGTLLSGSCAKSVPEASVAPAAASSTASAKPQTSASSDAKAPAGDLDKPDIKPMAVGGGAPAPSLAPTPTGKASASVASAKPYTGSTSLGSVSSKGVSNAAAVLASERFRFEKCHRAALDSDPTDTGSVDLMITVAKGGEATDSKTTAKGHVSPWLVTCTESVVRLMKFEGSGQITVRITYAK